MPVMTGIEACKNIREICEKSRISGPKIICFSAYDLKNTFKDFGFDSYLPKPFNQNNLDSAISNASSSKEQKGSIS
jgi:CheY-like chemotaxis protein